MQGILGPENIAIHVAQNAVNFLASSLAWLAIGAFASQTSLSGRGIDPEIISAAAAAGLPTTTCSLRERRLVYGYDGKGRRWCVGTPLFSSTLGAWMGRGIHSAAMQVLLDENLSPPHPTTPNSLITAGPEHTAGYKTRNAPRTYRRGRPRTYRRDLMT